MRAFLEAYPHGSNRGALAPLAEDHVDPIVLAANTSYAHPIPAGAAYVLFSFDGDVYAKFGTSGVGAASPRSASSRTARATSRCAAIAGSALRPRVASRSATVNTVTSAL